ncbi:hypothetical protein THER5_1905 [Bifidobacterium thermacidophilum subsp. thermacidophilum]|uniref:Uncharacterized protein n=1 Tax=Bifidobacterium thermacidophilum subsp. thermacidophilum TaxID=79262 RepID=A0A087E2E7_9BIFI|nr:hypothetical protein THER5_1905 [Bifidobacterium thermacidophilum subsp. thermacidophilum]
MAVAYQTAVTRYGSSGRSSDWVSPRSPGCSPDYSPDCSSAGRVAVTRRAHPGGTVALAICRRSCSAPTYAPHTRPAPSARYRVPGAGQRASNETALPAIPMEIPSHDEPHY